MAAIILRPYCHRRSRAPYSGVSIDEGQDETRPFQRARSPRALAEIILTSGSRPFNAGDLCVIQVETVDGISEWFRGALTTPRYDNLRAARTFVHSSCLAYIRPVEAKGLCHHPAKSRDPR